MCVVSRDLIEEVWSERAGDLLRIVRMFPDVAGFDGVEDVFPVEEATHASVARFHPMEASRRSELHS